MDKGGVWAELWLHPSVTYGSPMPKPFLFFGNMIITAAKSDNLTWESMGADSLFQPALGPFEEVEFKDFSVGFIFQNLFFTSVLIVN